MLITLLFIENVCTYNNSCIFVSMVVFFFQIVPNTPSGLSLLTAHYRVDGHPHINTVREVIRGKNVTYLFFPTVSTDLHCYVRTRRRLKEPQARYEKWLA